MNARPHFGMLNPETQMKRFPRLSIPALASLLCLAGALSLPALAAPPDDGAVLTDTGRPAEDKARDTARKPSEMLSFANVHAGQTVVDFMPGRGYFTRIFSLAVGEQGKVYAVNPQLFLDLRKGKPPLPSVAGEPGHGNVRDIVASNTSLNLPVQADLVWTAQNYHDMRIWGGADGIAQFNKAVFDALKPGGLYVVLDHSGASGLDDEGMKKLHRIDEAQVKREVLAAGFVLDNESPVLRNPGDPKTANVYDAAIRGKTDQFILRFHKPH